jgi:LacI family transcriptional regulator
VTPESRAGLLDRYVTAVIKTPLPEVCREVVGLMTAAVINGVSSVAGQSFMRPEIVVPESVD